MVQAQLSWENLDQVPVFAANQFIAQLEVSDPQQGPPALVLTAGYLAPPLLPGTPEEQRNAAAALKRLTVRPIARFSIPAARAAELAQIIQDLFQRLEAGGQQT
jgi:hypothetical protein